jgi:reverse gyrase
VESARERGRGRSSTEANMLSEGDERRLENDDRELVKGVEGETIYFLPAFLAEAVTLPALGSLRVTALMTPTATVCLMSRTAKRPRGG